MRSGVFATGNARYSAGVSPKAPGSGDPTTAIDSGLRAFARDLRTLPNVVSIARVGFVYIAIALWYFNLFALGLGIGVLAGLSDYLDGYLARRLNQSTRIGALLDQAADVIFISGCIFIFVDERTWPAILLFVVLFRDIVVLNLRASAAEMGFAIPSIFLGKWSSNWMFWSLALMGAARGELLAEPISTWIRYVAHFGMFVGVVSSLITAGIYLRSYASRYQPTSAPSALPAPQGGSDQVAHGGAGDDR